MSKNIITKILVISILLILLSFSIKASIFATIGMKGLSFASPQAAQAVQTVMQAYQITTDPSGYITGEIAGKLTGEIMGEIAKQSPEAAKAIQQYQQVKGWVDEGAKITEDLKLTSDGQLAGGSMTIPEKQNVETITDKKISDIENMEISTKGEKEPYQLKAAEDGASATIGKNTYANLGKGSTITVDRETGDVKEMDATFTEATPIKIGEDEILANKGTRVVYKDGKYTVYDKDQTVEINKQKVHINGENSIGYDNKKITGKDFTLDEKRFTGMEGKDAEITITDKGYVLGKNTIAENERITITSEKGNVLYAKMCGDVSGFSNYVNPCRKTLTVEGEGFSVQLKEGKNFGLDIEKEAIFEYEMKGGKIALDNGEQTIYTKEGKSVIITNGGTVTEYRTIDGIQEALVSPESVGESIEVDASTKSGNLITVEDSKTGTETIYACPIEGSGAVVITGAVSLLERCKSIVGLNTGNNMVGKPMWAEDKSEVVVEEEKLEKFEIEGKIYYSRIIRSTKADYSIFSDGSVRIWDKDKLKWADADFTLTDEHLDYFGMPKTKEMIPVHVKETLSQSEQPSSLQQKAQKPDWVYAYEQTGQIKWDKDRKYMENRGEGDIYGIAFYTEREMGWITSLPNGQGSRSEPVKAVKDNTGKVIRYESVSSPLTYIPIGSGKVKLVPANR